MTLKYAYIHPTTREYLYADTPEEVISAMATFAAQVYIEHYCNGQPYTFVEVQEDGFEKWFAPSGEPVISPVELEKEILKLQSFTVAGEVPVTTLGNS